MKLEIISHCWRYSRMLMYQLSSLVLYPPKNIEVYPHIWYTNKDRKTRIMLRYFQERLPNLMKSRLPIEKLRKRAIGRNIAAHASQADVVWFCDGDYVFGKGCLDTLAADMDIKDNRIHYPETIQLHNTHALGAKYAKRVTEAGVYDIEPADFFTFPIPRAIGGLQIVCGDLARRMGYCDPDCIQPNRNGRIGGRPFYRVHKWCVIAHEPQTTAEFLTPEDVLYRECCPRGRAIIHLPNLYRLRQAAIEGDKGEHPVDTL